MCRRRAEVGEASAFPTPTPVGVSCGLGVLMGDGPWSTALEERRPAIELQNACRESWVCQL